ncbi:MAG: SRPBCC family protein [Ferrovibrio sp.]|uniref:SRPBCC family protein n=1 Tax=Ferrovibrio sp. TaxID=1917215 RepID=UPI003918D741
MLKTIALGGAGLLAVAIVIVLVIAAAKPDVFRVQRSVSIKAAPEKIFPLIDDLHVSMAWSPYEDKDPTMKRSHGGPRSGKGAFYEWDGNKEVGSGRLTITESTAPTKVAMALDMTRPFECHNIVEYTLAPQGDATVVTWAMQGPAPFIAKVMQVFFDMDKMVGRDFEVGLASLKTMAEG